MKYLVETKSNFRVFPLAEMLKRPGVYKAIDTDFESFRFVVLENRVCLIAITRDNTAKLMLPKDWANDNFVESSDSVSVTFSN